MESRSEKGFTLIEMMIVVALIGILLAIGVPSIMSQRPLWRTNGAARELLTNMRLTQSKSIRAGDPFSISFDGPGRTYTIFRDDGENGGTKGNGIQDGDEVTIKTVTLYTQVKFGVIGSPDALKGGAIETDGINFTSKGGGAPKSMTFHPDGSVRKPDGTAEDGTAYFYPDTTPQLAAWQRAVEVVGNTGRVKVYSWSTDGSGEWL